MASLEEQQPKRVRARTQQLQRKQERSALAGSALGACGWEDSPGVASGVEVREERGCEDRRAGGLG